MITFKQFLSEGKISTEHGYIEFDWKKDLADEEDEDYLPPGYRYDKVIELKMLSVTEPGKGHGSELMKKFLASPMVKKAELIFADPVPGMDANFDSKVSDEDQINAIKNFNKKFGFRSRPGTAREWLVLKGSIPDDQLPT